MKKVTNKEIAARFTAAKAHLWDGSSKFVSGSIFICYAVDNATNKSGKRSCHVGAACKVIINERLGGETSLDSWLRERYKSEWALAWAKLNREERSLKLQTTRHAWLDSLIKEFSA